MKKTLATLAAALALATLSANAGTINVFAQYIGTASYSSPSQERQDAYAAVLSQGDIDFGVFYGPSKAANFGFTHADYTKHFSSEAGGCGGFHVFIYKTSRWQLVKRYALVKANKNSADACVMEDKTTGERFAFVMPVGNSYRYANIGTDVTAINSIKNSCQDEHSEAKMLFGVSYTNGYYFSNLRTTIVNYGCTLARNGTKGAMYAQNHDSRTTLSAGSVSWLPNAPADVEPAAVGRDDAEEHLQEC